MDKRLTNTYYEIEIDPETNVPVRISLMILAGQREGTETKGRKIVGGKHAAFHFTYRLEEFGKLEMPEIPAAAQKLLAAR